MRSTPWTQCGWLPIHEIGARINHRPFLDSSLDRLGLVRVLGPPVRHDEQQVDRSRWGLFDVAQHSAQRGRGSRGPVRGGMLRRLVPARAPCRLPATRRLNPSSNTPTRTPSYLDHRRAGRASASVSAGFRPQMLDPQPERAQPRSGRSAREPQSPTWLLARERTSTPASAQGPRRPLSDSAAKESPPWVGAPSRESVASKLAIVTSAAARRRAVGCSGPAKSPVLAHRRADTPAEHDVADRGERRHLRFWSAAAER